MTKIQILGSGCDKCKKLAANAKLAAEQLNLPCEMEKVENINQITAFGVMMTPALVVNGKVVSSGKVLTPGEIAGFLASPVCDCGGQCTSSETKMTESPCCCKTPAESTVPCCGNGGSEKKSACCCNGSGKKKFMTILLLLFIMASIGFMVIKRIKGRSSVTPAVRTEQTTPAVSQKKDPLTVYYFHGNQHSMTCNKMEQLTRQAVEEKYAEELASGKIVFRSVNVEEPVNEHFIKNFGLTGQNVVVSGNGRFEKFDSVWDLIREPEKFLSYIQGGIKKMMEKSLPK